MAVEVVVPGDAFRMPVKVRYYETDQQKVVFNSWYLAYFDEALAEFLTSVGYPYQQLLADGSDTMLVHTELDWTGSLTWGDLADVVVSPVAVGNTSVTLDFAIVRGDRSLCSARTVYVVVDATTLARTPVPARLAEALHDRAPLRRSRAGR